MTTIHELRLAELIAARISHDLVGPVGAAVNGVELLVEDEAPDADVLRLIGQSARQASRRLQLFRVIYGTPGALPSGAPFAAAAKLLADVLEGDKVSLGAWEVDPALDAAAGRAGARATLLAGFLLAEALPRGGVLRLSGALTGPADAHAAKMVWHAKGTGARVFEEVDATLAGKVPLGEVTPKSVPAAVLRRLAAEMAGQASFSPGKDEIGLTLTFSAPGER